MRLSPLSSAVLLALLVALPVAGQGKAAALHIDAGSVAERQVVAIGRDVEVLGRARSDVAALNGRALISGEVEGDVIVLGGGVRLEATARVDGDVFVLGGEIVAAPGAQIGGRSVAYPDASGAWLAFLEAPTLGFPSNSSLVLGAKLALVAGWLALVLGFFAAAGRQVLATSDTVAAEPFRCFAMGLVGVITLVLTALFFSLFAAALVGLPLLALVVLLAVVLKLWGMVAVFHAVGTFALRRFRGRRVTALNTAVLGLLLLSAVKLIPWFGLLAWQVATFIGVGAALATKLGRREPWFDLSPQAAI